MIDLVARQLPDDSPPQARQIATGALATMVGSILLSRAVCNRALSDDILEAGRKAVARQAAVRKARRRTSNTTS